MAPNALTRSALLCLLLAVGPATVLSAPATQDSAFQDSPNALQDNGIPNPDEYEASGGDLSPSGIPNGPSIGSENMMGSSYTERDLPLPNLDNALPLSNGVGGSTGSGNSQSDAGTGFSAGIPGGPAVHFGAGVHETHHGPCGPGYSDAEHAGTGFSAGIPGGPAVHFGAHADHEHEAVPCPPVPVSVIHYTTPIVVPTVTTVPSFAPSITPAPHLSTPLIPRPTPTPSSAPVPVPVYNAASPLSPGFSFLAIALPVILALF